MKKFFSKKKILFIVLAVLLLASLVITYTFVGSKNITKYVYTADQAVGDEYEFGFTGSSQEFVTPYTGVYKLEVYGAAGGDQESNGFYGRDALGGRGGYSVGYLTLDKDQVLYVYVGGKGENVSNQIVNQRGGYNGGAGGSSYIDTTCEEDWKEINNNTIYIAPGGGATHIATANRGTLNTYYSNRDDVLIVAGGGGGAIYSYCSGKTYSQSGSTYENWIDPGYGNGGAGGGSVGSPTLTNVRNWQGSGENGFASGATGGGGGWKSGYNAAGATGYIGSTLTEGLMESNVREGNGYAKITLMEVSSFTISYEANGGEGTTESTITGVQDINGKALGPVAENNFTKAGYTFESWNTKQDGTGERYPAGGELLIGENTTLYAQWVPTTYSINYVLNGGEAENVEEYNIETENFILNNPTKVGYRFIGWTGSNGEEAQLSVRVEKGSYGAKEFVANWEANTDTTYVVRHWLQKQNSNPNEYTEENYKQKALNRYSGVSDAVIEPAVNTYIGFTSPTPQEYSIKPDGSLIVDYYYPRNQYTFTLEETEGVDTVGSTQSGTYYYEDVITLTEQTKEGYTWIGWSNGQDEETISITVGTSDIVIKPIATKNVYTISYKTNEMGSSETVFSEENPGSYTVTTPSFTLVNPTKEGYEFLGWTYEGQEEPQKEVTVNLGSTGDLEFTANWIPEGNTSYKVNYWLQKIDSENVESLDEENYTKEETKELIGETDSLVTVEVKEYEGFTAPEPVEVSILPNGKLEVNYYYARNKYELKVEETEGVETEESTPNGMYHYGKEIAVKAVAKEGYTWQKWVDVEAEDEIEFEDFTFAMPSREVTLRPVVTKNLYTIVYNLDEGELKDAKETYTVTDENYTLPTPEKEGYIFTGWTYEGMEEPEMVVIIEKGSIGNLEFTATWEKDEHTKYKIEHYIENVEQNGYELYATENKEGTTYDEVIAEPQSIAGFKFDTKNGSNVIIGRIARNGSLTLKLYYTRNVYPIVLEANGGKIEGENATAYLYGVETNLPEQVTRQGYIFRGWYDNEELEGEAIVKIEAGEVGVKTYYAKWEEEVEEELKIETEEYVIDEENSIIEEIETGTYVKDFIQKIRVNREVKILDRSGNELGENSLIGTGCKLQIKEDESTVVEYELLVIGDIDGNGRITITDLTSLNEVLVKGVANLTGRKAIVYKKVLDMNKNGQLTITDLTILLNKILKGETSIE